MNKFNEKCSTAKRNYYTNMVEDLKNSNPRQWYSKLKRMSNVEGCKMENIYVEQLEGLDKMEQAEVIAEDFSKISNQYDKIDRQALKLKIETSPKPVPSIEPHEIFQIMSKMKTNKSTIKNDIPAKKNLPLISQILLVT